MSKKIYVGGLPYSFSDKDLEEVFSKFGKVTSVNVITDKFTNESKGFAFVEMKKESEAIEAINSLNNTQLGGRTITVNEAKPREERPRNNDYNQNESYHRKSRGFGGRRH